MAFAEQQPLTLGPSVLPLVHIQKMLRWQCSGDIQYLWAPDDLMGEDEAVSRSVEEKQQFADVMTALYSSGLGGMAQGGSAPTVDAEVEAVVLDILQEREIFFRDPDDGCYKPTLLARQYTTLGTLVMSPQRVVQVRDLHVKEMNGYELLNIM